MFAPLVVKPQAKAAAQSGDLSAFRRATTYGHDRDVELASTSRRPPPDQIGPHFPDSKLPGAAWSFSSIPLYPPERADGWEPAAPVPAPRLPGPIQRKLKVGLVNDPLEHEADRVADQVLRMPDHGAAMTSAQPQVGCKCAVCEQEEKLQKMEAGPQAAFSEAPASVHEVLRSPGQPLDAATRAYFEPRFGQDFSGVRVHTGTSAAQSARDVNAHAYTVGQNMVFDAGRFAPGTHEGRRLIAHELTHVVQQTSLRLSQSTRLQRQPRSSGRREATIEVSWSEDEEKFYSRVVAALGVSAGFRGINAGTYNAASATEHTLYALVSAFRARYHEAFHHEPKAGEIVKLHLSAFYDPREDSLTGKQLSFAADPATQKGLARSAPEASAACATVHKANETDSERTTREIEESSCFIGKLLLTGDRQNAAFADITITSESTYPSKIAYGGTRQRRSGEAPLTYAAAYAATRALIEGFHIAIAHTPSVIEIEFSLENGPTVEHAWTNPLPPKGTPAAPAEEADDDECHDSDVDYGECLKLQRTEAYQEAIAAAETEFKDWYDPYGLSGGGGGGGFHLPLPGPVGKLKIPKALRRLSKSEKLQRIDRSAGMAMKELAGGIHGIRGRLKGQAIAVVEVEVGTTIRYAAATSSGAGWSSRQTALLRDLSIEQIPPNLGEAVHAEGNVRAWVDGLKKSGQKVRVKRWGISAGINGKYICAGCREIVHQMGGIIEEF
jgi:hypothetical protein